MTEHHAWPAPARIGCVEPGNQRGGLGFFRRSLGAQHQPAVGIDIAQPREAIDDESKAFFAFEGFVPEIRPVAVEPVQQSFGIVLQGALELAGAFARATDIPLRRQACVQEAGIQRVVFVKERAARQPVEQCLAVGGREYVVESVVAADAARSESHGEKVQIVVAERDRRRIAERPDPAQHRQGVRPAIDEISDEPQPVAIRRELQCGEQLAEFGIAALYVADCVKRHQPPTG